jgi:hypothetical protein
MACATDDQCVAKFGGDACKANIKCDPATSVCTYNTLDKDGDGHPPPVCGGDDCDDSDGTKAPGSSELCDGKDNDCNAAVDNGATCAGLTVCQGGACVCPAPNACGNECVDKTTDPNNCGACNNKCASGAMCVASQCVCAPNAMVCNGQCVDTMTDPSNCNGCGNVCATGYMCQAGACTCLKTSCNGACVDTTSDATHCGNCATVCPPGAACQNSKCVCPQGLTPCGGACVNTLTDPKNCGACGTNCAACNNGTCIVSNCDVSDLLIVQDLSGSMTTNDVGGTRWDAARSGINAFLANPQSAGFGVGIGYYPVGPACVTSADCTGGIACTAGRCVNEVSCDVADYSTPAVPVGMLPGVAAAITSSMSGQAAIGTTPQLPAMEGMLAYAKSYASANPGRDVAVVLIADGLANTCSTPDVPTEVASLVATYASGSPPVRTFVIAIGTDVPVSSWDAIAGAGGTGKARLVVTGAPGIEAALNQIRTKGACCASANDCVGVTGQCTVGACDPLNGCVAAPANNGAACNDGLASPCSQGKCQNAACVPQPINNGAACDDLKFCTVGDQCAGGTCVGAPKICPPQGACMVGSCDEAADLCTVVPGNNGAACDDGSPCTGSTTCAGGACVNGVPTNNGMMCNDGVSCTSGEVCGGGVCGGGAGPAIYFRDDFSDNAAGWTLGPEWQIGPAMMSSGGAFGADPSFDHSASADNGVAGVVIGGNASTSLHSYYYLESPPFNTANAPGAVVFSFFRWLNSDYAPYMYNAVEVWNGLSWVNLWTSGGSPGIEDSPPDGLGWTYIEHDVTPYKNASMRVRFGFSVQSSNAFTIGSWNVDDVVVASASCP